MGEATTFAKRCDDLLELAESLAADMECRTPANGAPGHPHCAACCYGTLINASCQVEFDFAVALLNLIAAAQAYFAAPEPVDGQ